MDKTITDLRKQLNNNKLEIKCPILNVRSNYTRKKLYDINLAVSERHLNTQMTKQTDTYCYCWRKK